MLKATTQTHTGNCDVKDSSGHGDHLRHVTSKAVAAYFTETLLSHGRQSHASHRSRHMIEACCNVSRLVVNRSCLQAQVPGKYIVHDTIILKYCDKYRNDDNHNSTMLCKFICIWTNMNSVIQLGKKGGT